MNGKRMSKKIDAVSKLKEARMHAECMNEAFYEMDMTEPSEERKRVIRHELSARVWAVVHLLHAVIERRELNDREMEAVNEARRYNGCDCDACAADIAKNTH